MSEEILTLEFDENEPVRLDHFLTDELPDYSRSRLQSFIKDGRVRIDGEPAKKYGQMLVPGQMITVLLPEEREAFFDSMRFLRKATSPCDGVHAAAMRKNGMRDLYPGTDKSSYMAGNKYPFFP